MSRTPTQDKAIAWWCETNNLIPQLSTHPVYYFKTKDTGQVTKRNPENLTNDYKEFVKDSKIKDGKRSA